MLPVLVALIALSLGSPSARAQDVQAGVSPEADETLDEEARALFSAGNTAFDAGRFEDALGYFQRAYELSHRPVLLYNIGITADRLRRDDQALTAFEQFVAELPEHPHHAEVLARVRALRTAREARETAMEEEVAGSGDAIRAHTLVTETWTRRRPTTATRTTRSARDPWAPRTIRR